MNLNDIGINLDNYTNYCGVSMNGFVIGCLSDNNTIISIELSGHDFESKGYQFNFSDNLGFPPLIKKLEFYRLLPTGLFDFEFIYPLAYLEELSFVGHPNGILLEGTIHWEKISQMESLKILYMEYRNFLGDVGIISQFSTPLEQLDLLQTYSFGIFNMNALYSIQDTLVQWNMGDPRGDLTTYLDLNVLINCSNLITFDIHGSNALGTISTINSMPLPNTLEKFKVQDNNLNGIMNWDLFRNIQNMEEFMIFDNSELNGTVDWDIVTSMFSNRNSDDQTTFRIENTGLIGNNANFTDLDLWWISMDKNYHCDSSIYCREEYGFYSIDRSHTGFGKRLGIIPACTCLCSNGSFTVISDLCPTTNFTFSPTPLPSIAPTQDEPNMGRKSPKKWRKDVVIAVSCTIVIVIIIVLCGVYSSKHNLNRSITQTKTNDNQNYVAMTDDNKESEPKNLNVERTLSIESVMADMT